MTDYGDHSVLVPERNKAYIVNEDGMIQITYEVDE